MKCYICDRSLEGDEIKIDPNYGTFDPCGTCLTIIGEVFEPLDEDEVTYILDEEWGDFLSNEEKT